MRETPAAFTLRTSIAYTPPARARPLARPLAADEPCPTLFRYVGPCGMADWFAGELARLAPGALTWMSARTVVDDSAGARHFGTLAVLQPMRLHPGAHGDGLYVADARPLDAVDEVVWVPPGLLAAALPWDGLATAAQAVALIGAAARRARGVVIASLARYLEELDAMRRCGAPGPGIPWCQVSDDERRRRLAAAGVHAVWTGWRGLDTIAA